MRCNRFSTVLTLAAVAMGLFAGTASADLVTELGILDLTVNGGVNPATTAPWAAGDQYRLTFVSSTRTNALSGDIAYYSAHVQAAANAAGLGGVTWNAIASTSAAYGGTATVDARDNTSTNFTVDPVGMGIFLIDGYTIIADNYTDLWDNSIDARLDKSEYGTVVPTHDGPYGPWKSVWAGTTGTGTNRGAAALGGNNRADLGLAVVNTTAQWIRRADINPTDADDLCYVYGMSDPLTLTDDAVGPEPLRVDFNSNQNGGGSSSGGDPQSTTANHNQSGWESYHANHEAAAEFTTGTYPGGITVTPAWPNTTDNRVQQSIDRGGQNTAGDVTGGTDNTWAPNGTLIGDAGDLNLVTDWLGIDTRTGNGGNGNWDGASAGTPTYMTLTLGGLSAGEYLWTSYHHDTENVHTFFQIELSTDGGANYTNLGQDFYMTDGSDGGNPDSATDGAPFGPQKGLLLTPDPFLADNLPSTVNFNFTANGTDVVVLRFAPLSGQLGNGAVHNQLWGINGFTLDQVQVIPEPSTFVLAALGLLGLAWFGRRRRRLS